MTYLNDVGGLHGFGPLELDGSPDEPFHSVWEGELFMTMFSLVASGQFTLDQFRYAIERLPPAEYLTLPYYERWLAAVEQVMAQRGLM